MAIANRFREALMGNAFFIALQDAKHQLRQGSTLVWVFVMPPIFFFFIGTVTGGFSSGVSSGAATPITVVAESPGFLREQIDLRLRENDFSPTWFASLVEESGEQAPSRVLTIEAGMTSNVLAGEQVAISFETRASALRREFEIIRAQRSLYTALADIVVAEANSGGEINAAALLQLNERPRAWLLNVSAAGQRQHIPTGFEQAIPGTLVMFTLLVLLTSGGTMLVLERKQGLLRRLASAPIGRSEVVAGKWGGRMLIAVLQVGAAVLVGTFAFKMAWGPNFAMVMLVLAVWAGFCASAGLLLGSLASTEGQASGLGVLAANALAALGGCWWPIEVTPDWMQTLQNFTPTGWTMDALHKLISFQAEASSVLPQISILIIATVVLAAVAVRRFQYD